MCGRKSGMFLLLSVLASLLLVSHCFSEVVLTDEEAEEMLSEMEQSRAELTELREMSENLQTELDALKATSTEQNRYYEKQLKEAKKARAVPWAVAGTSTATAVFLGVLLVIILL